MKINSLSCFLVGLGAGAAISLLFAPKSGEDARRYLREKAEDGQQLVDRGASKLQEMMDKGKENIKWANGAINDAVEAGKAAVPA